MTSSIDFEYDVAISFLGEDLTVAEELASRLRDRMNVFLFTERQGDIAGSDGVDTLSAVFGHQSRLAVILYRAGWGDTPWTRVEETAIKNRGLETGWDFLLVIPLEATPQLPRWIPRTQIWLSYQQYGLPAAVAVLERKLEEAGGTAKPVTAADRARELAHHEEWKAERQRRRGQEGVEAVKAHLVELFAELDRAGSESGGGIAFKRPRENAARVYSSGPDGEGTTVTLYWSQQWGNTLDQSGLRVRLWKGYAPAAGENPVAFEEAKELQQHEFDFEFSESRRWTWQHCRTQRQYDNQELAAFCIGLLIDRITGR